jgi:hypothetical protein
MFGAEASLLPLPEREFGLGWANLVEIIAATRWPPDFNSTSLQQVMNNLVCVVTTYWIPFLYSFV